MAETLLAILLITSSAEKSTVAFRWPSHPRASPRFIRQKPIIDPVKHADAAWWASHYDAPLSSPTGGLDPKALSELAREEGFQCEWRPPGSRSALRKSVSRHRRGPEEAGAGSRPGSGRNTPVMTFEEDFFEIEEKTNGEFSDVLGFTTSQLGRMLSPGKRGLYHRKFELVVDDLVFIGHPVCKDEDGVWRERERVGDCPEGKEECMGRGRGAGRTKAGERASTSTQTPLNSFHLVLVLDHPDPSSTASGNLAKYFEQIYEHVSVPFARMLLREQAETRLVEIECEYLGVLEEECVMDGEC
jgi:hypothetical protein